MSTDYKGGQWFISRFNDSRYRYPYSSTFITNCTGDAITQINACISEVDQLGSAIDSLYDSTSAYLTRVHKNYCAAEANNILATLNARNN